MTASQSTLEVIDEIELVPGELDDIASRYVDQASFVAPRNPVWRAFDDLLPLAVLPIAIAFAYFFVIAAPYYASEAQFVIRTNANSSLGGLESLIQSEGLSRAADDSYVVIEYLHSRDLVQQLQWHDRLRAFFARPEADMFTRYPNFYSDDKFEALYRHYQSWIHTNLDENTGITTLRAYAYRSDDAKAFAETLLAHAEQLINRLNVRAHDDAVRYATVFVDLEERKILDTEHRLTEFRNVSGSIDPSKEANILLETIGHLNTDVAELEASLRQQEVVMPSSPNIANLKERIASYHQEIDALRQGIAGGPHSTASHLEVFDGLMLERELNAKTLEAAVANLNRANQESQAHHVYLEPITQPNLPDSPEKWPRIFAFLGISCLSLCIWSAFRSIKRAGTGGK